MSAINSDAWQGYDYLSYDPIAGDVIEREHPFTRMIGAFEDLEFSRWRPGVWGNEFNGIDDFYPFAHAAGRVEYVVRAVCPVPGFPMRVFYTRQFTDPDGKILKRSGLICHSIGPFRMKVSRFSGRFDFAYKPSLGLVESDGSIRPAAEDAA
jgi:hypothetical protein